MDALRGHHLMMIDLTHIHVLSPKTRPIMLRGSYLGEQHATSKKEYTCIWPYAHLNMHVIECLRA
jgi:hypothetical protein